MQASILPGLGLTFLLEWPRQSETLPPIRLCTSALSSMSEGGGDQSWGRGCTRDSNSWAEGRLGGPSRALEYSAGFPEVAVEDSPGRASLQQDKMVNRSGLGFLVWHVQPGRCAASEVFLYCPPSLTPQMAPFLVWRGGASPSTLLEGSTQGSSTCYCWGGETGTLLSSPPHSHENGASVLHLRMLINK